MTLSPEKTVRDIAIENPPAVRVFELLGIDYCCGGRRPLAEACASAGVSVNTVIEQLAVVAPHDPTAKPKHWEDATASELITNIVESHHAFVRRETPRTEGLLAKLVNRHGPSHPELGEIQQLFLALSQELATHMMKEEQILFPYVRNLEAGIQTSACFPSVAMPISAMIAEHEDAGALLERMRELSHGYTPPEDACPTYRATFQALADFERDLHFHVHLENNILFPKAAALEVNSRRAA